MAERTFEVPGINCKHCTMTIKRELGELEGVTSVSADVDSRMVTVGWQSPATWDDIKALLVEINYPPAE